MRFSEATPFVSPLSEIFGREILELDTNADVHHGSFSRAVSRQTDSPIVAIEEAVAIAADDGCGDLLVCPVVAEFRDSRGVFHRTKRWQVWERRIVTGRVATCGGGTRAKREAFGRGRIFVL